MTPIRPLRVAFAAALAPGPRTVKKGILKSRRKLSRAIADAVLQATTIILTPFSIRKAASSMAYRSIVARDFVP